jgi:hypothetical protein
LLLLDLLHLNLRPGCYRKEQRQGKHDPEKDRKKSPMHALPPSTEALRADLVRSVATDVFYTYGDKRATVPLYLVRV